MKKTLLAGLTLALLASLATSACGKKDEHSAPAGPAAPAAGAGAAAAHAPTAPGAVPQSPAPPPAEAIAGKAAPADAIHGPAAGTKAGDPHAGIQSPQVAPGTGRKGKVVETMDASSYTYIKLDEKGKTVWLAVMQQKIKVGQTVEFPDVPPMVNFTSKTLNRTFDSILFVPSIRVE